MLTHFIYEIFKNHIANITTDLIRKVIIYWEAVKPMIADKFSKILILPKVWITLLVTNNSYFPLRHRHTLFSFQETIFPISKQAIP